MRGIERENGSERSLVVMQLCVCVCSGVWGSACVFVWSVTQHPGIQHTAKHRRARERRVAHFYADPFISTTRKGFEKVKKNAKGDLATACLKLLWFCFGLVVHRFDHTSLSDAVAVRLCCAQRAWQALQLPQPLHAPAPTDDVKPVDA